MNYFFREFDIENFDSIQKKLVPFILEIANEREEKYILNPLFDYQIDRLRDNIPEFFETVKKITGQYPKKINFTYQDHNCSSEEVAHVDFTNEKGDSFFRLNWPIINSESFKTIFFYTSSAPLWKEYEKGVYAFHWRESLLEVADYYIQSKPVLIDVTKIHGFYPIKEEFPRIVLTIKLEAGWDPALRSLLRG